ncbi:autotransporter outer membrane beta-barrel domain-containing protein [Helicobacter sp. 'CLO3_human']|uniref:autotransporter outer membrane beta-barrel domain-containing protein n=1 Tax=Helicobacter sp. 'CLO3_human' TaxID=2020249 RepID=UPI000CF0B2E0|nr:autotransporter outer membrane beta-barrel domain-containing protein [Helicobacter sp. 'CLO3_human']
MYLEKSKEKDNVSLTNPLIKTSQKSIFKPIIASSLALFLGSSFVYANCSGNNGAPVLCVGNLENEVITNKLTWKDDSGMYAPQLQGDTINLAFKFRYFGDMISDASVNGNETVFYANTRSVVIKSNGVGIKTSSLRVYFDELNDKKFTLDLSNTNNSNPSFQGDLEIKGEGFYNVFDAKLKNGMKGNIFLNSSSMVTFDLMQAESKIEGHITSDIKGGNLTIKNGMLVGNIGGQVLSIPGTKDLTIVFDGTKMQGDIQTGSGDLNGNDFQRKEITFMNLANNSEFALTGSIISYGSGYGLSLDRNKGNHVTFEKGSMKGHIQTYRDRAQRVGYNEVIFKDDGAKLEGNIEALGGSIKGSMSATNKVVFEQSGTVIGQILAKSDSLKDLIYSSSFQGKNEVFFNGSNNKIENVDPEKTEKRAAILAQSSINEVIFNNRHANNTIVGEIIAEDSSVTINRIKATNIITFNGGTNTITGNIFARKSNGSVGDFIHENIITFNGGNSIINGYITTDNSSEVNKEEVRYGGRNILNLKNATLTIKNNVEGKDLDPIIALNKGSNIINFEGDEVILTLQRTNNINDGLIYTRDVSSVITVNFNAKSSILNGGITSGNGVIAINLNGDRTRIEKALSTSSYGTLNLSFSNNAVLSIGDKLISETTSNFKGTVNINLASDGIVDGIIDGNIDLKGETRVYFDNNSALNLIGGNATKTISNLTTVGDGVINISGQARWQEDFVSKDSFQTLEIGNLSSNKPVKFIVSVNPNASSVKSDRIIIEGNGVNNSDIHYLGVLGNPDELIGKDLYTQGSRDNIVLATVANISEITLQTTDSINGFSLVTYDFDTETTGRDAQSGSGYTTYFLGSAKSNGASLANQLASASALSANYDLYLANLNSLNKRMGELRNNANSQGVWIRVFNGMQTSKFALETKSIYTTIQAGYDYAFGSNGANNYLGFAFSYANSITDTKSINDRANNGLDMTRGIKRINSNAMEFAIYNAYVQDGASRGSGWKNGFYSDSILKFSRITSKLDLLGQTETYDTDNFAVTFSQEFGYRFLFGSFKEIFVEPQVEVASGYLNQSDLKQKLGQATLDGVQNSIFTVRTRVGSSFGYDFKNFTQDKGFNSKIYLGTYFVNDYISGGDVSLTDKYNAKVSLSPLSTTSRFVLNVGTNFSIKDNHRIYFDFERSFGGKIITDYQVNLGYRYSFGASKYTPYNGVSTTEIKQVESIKEMAPTKGFYLQVF